MQTKSEMINRIAELAKENAELKALVSQRDASVTAQTGIILELQAENEKLEEATHSLLNIQYALAYSCKKYSETLQEIKTIAEKEIYMKQNSSMNNIIDLITKAESEG